jgi:redox-sensitive bicupin YhaK (pirin superfamily)
VIEQVIEGRAKDLGGFTDVMLIGGAPLDGPRHIWWNFISSSEARIEQAKADWREGRFPRVPGDEIEFIPLPERL